jgi:calcineurin-like phosphoesterase family protein
LIIGTLRFQRKDMVYHLGDFGFGHPKKLYELSLKLNGRIYLIRGNHDKSTVKEPCCNRFEWIKDTHFLTAQLKGTTYEFHLSHYSHRVWNKIAS